MYEAVGRYVRSPMPAGILICIAPTDAAAHALAALINTAHAALGGGSLDALAHALAALEPGPMEETEVQVAALLGIIA